MTQDESPFPPIADYGFLSDCHTGALLASDGSIEWLCLPNFDSPSVFAAMLDRGAGRFRVGPYGLYVPAGRRYLPGTNIIETTWMTPQGWVRVVDALTVGEWHDNQEGSSHTRPPTDYDADHLLVRVIECIQGQVQMEMVCEPMCQYGALMAGWHTVEDERTESGPALDAVADGDDKTAFRLFSDMRMGVEGNRVHARHTLQEGERRFCAMSWTEGLGGPRTVEQAEAHIERTSHFWRTWLAEGTYPDHPWRLQLQRSALVLKGLTFMPTGALVAAATTSLPETPHGSRNWDYRYCWMRDATFTLWGLHALGLDWEADDFVQYVADLERNEDGSLQIMYGIEGNKQLQEQELAHLKGYEGARPVRIGNGAYNQRQNDVYGAVLDSVYLHSKKRDHIPERLWPVLIDQVRCAERVWREPDQGIWEARGEPRHYVSSKLMCWVAMDRGARLAERRGEDDTAEQLQRVADEIKAEILDKGVDRRGVFRQHYDTDALDASNLLIPLVRFLPPDDERVCATVRAIKEELTDNGLVLRYRTDETDDGQHGEEGTFLICSFWLVSALAEIGECRAAEQLCERLLTYASPLHLYAEELDASSGRLLGNFPQAFTHLGLINAVTHVIEAQQV
ncbi:MAG TPA: glycoside hydrolase family 15 protein [Solirubrobacteraceae bacterium]|jgi:GH15 family glucan-1,4-alpha-glucosidase|nr:glycoside hydrolase family 15 protein [Solirubrobacteraceae bacterium]